MKILALGAASRGEAGAVRYEPTRRHLSCLLHCLPCRARKELTDVSLTLSLSARGREQRLRRPFPPTPQEGSRERWRDLHHPQKGLCKTPPVARHHIVSESDGEGNVRVELSTSVCRGLSAAPSCAAPRRRPFLTDSSVLTAEPDAK